jgi:integrase
VAVWTARQLSGFLAGVADDSLYALWWLAALRGLRRGELCSLRWAAVDLDRGLLIVERNHTTAGYQVVEGEPPAENHMLPADRRPHGDPAPQLTTAPLGRAARTVTTPASHPRDTHHPLRPRTTKAPDRVPAAQSLVDLARLKGFGPLTL